MRKHAGCQKEGHGDYPWDAEYFTEPHERPERAGQAQQVDDDKWVVPEKMRERRGGQGVADRIMVLGRIQVASGEGEVQKRDIAPGRTKSTRMGSSPR